MNFELFRDRPFKFPPEQQPVAPGSPARPPHPASRRIFYGMTGILLGITSGLGNALVQANAANLQGSISADLEQLAWIPTAYVMSYVSMNLVLTRLRQKFGLRLYAMLGIIFYCLSAAFHLMARDTFGITVIQFVEGIASAPMISLATYYLISAMSPKNALRGAVISFGVAQLGTPLARLVPVEILALDGWRSLDLMQLGIALICLSCVALLRLPPSEKSDNFEALDLVTIPLIATGLALVVAVIGLGRVVWWDTVWLGWALCAAVAFLAAGLYTEHCRARPLIDLRWLGAQRLFQFGIVVVVLRIALAEQSTLAYGLLTFSGLSNADLVPYSTALLLAAILGVICSALVYKPERVLKMGVLSFLMIAIAACVDSYSTNLTRAPQLYATQMAVAFATTFGIGPTLLYGLVRTFGNSATPLTSFLALFAIFQILGAMIGNALLGTLQIVQEKSVSLALISRISSSDPVVQARISSLGGGDIGNLSLQAAMTREATFISYANCFAAVAAIALGGAVYLSYRIVIVHRGETSRQSRTGLVDL